MSWEVLGKIPPDELVEARMQIHWAMQIVAAVGSSLVPPAPDDSHTSMRWRSDEGMFVGAMTPKRFSAALRPLNLKVMLSLPTGTMLRSLDLPKQTLEDAFDWLNDAIAEVTNASSDVRIERPGYFMESHPLATGARFSLNPIVQLAELTQWFSNAAKVLEKIQLENENASPVRVWPHHMDMATLIVLDPDDAGAGDAPSINVGMSPGDAMYDAPYFYVRPWPPPQDAALPPLEGAGDWHTAGWLGAVLPAADVVHVADAELQGQAVMTHLHSSIEACRNLLGAT